MLCGSFDAHTKYSLYNELTRIYVEIEHKLPAILLNSVVYILFDRVSVLSLSL